MTMNVGSFDRIVRFIIGAAALSFALIYRESPYSILGWLGLIPLVTAVIGTCPLYSLLGVNTCSSR